MFNNKRMLVGLCIDAERQYNTCVSWSTDLGYSDLEDAMLQRMRDLYSETLECLKVNGIGGVLINGVFRDLFEGNSYPESEA